MCEWNGFGAYGKRKIDFKLRCCFGRCDLQYWNAFGNLSSTDEQTITRTIRDFERKNFFDKQKHSQPAAYIEII